MSRHIFDKVFINIFHAKISSVHAIASFVKFLSKVHVCIYGVITANKQTTLLCHFCDFQKNTFSDSIYYNDHFDSNEFQRNSLKLAAMKMSLAWQRLVQVQNTSLTRTCTYYSALSLGIQWVRDSSQGKEF